MRTYKARIAGAIREALDAEGFEIPWAEINAAADAVLDELEDVFDKAWRYEELQ